MNDRFDSALLDDTSVRLARWLGEDSASSAESWPGLAHDAGVRGLAGLILDRQNLRRSLPEDCRAELKGHAARAAFQYSHAIRQTAPIIESLDRAGIPVMLLKGAGLLQSVYAHPGLRPMCDIDLLVRAEQAVEAVTVMRSAGCRSGAALVRKDFFPRFHYEVELFIPGPHPVRLDLHARPFRPLRWSRIVPDDALWEGAVAVNVHGARAFVPRPELFFIHLAAHAAFHGCARLLWLHDLVQWMRVHGNAFDENLILARCGRWRLSAAVHQALQTAELTLGPFLPPTFLSRLSAQGSNWCDRLALRQAPQDARSPWRHVLVNLLCTPGIRFKLAYGRAMLTPDEGHLGSGSSSGFALLTARIRRLIAVFSRALRCILPTAAGRSEVA